MKNPHLASIKTRTSESIAEGHRNLVVFDLDSTLFDVSPRSENIVKDFSKDPLNTQKFPQETSLLRNIQIRPSEWGIRASVERLPFETPPSFDFFHGLKLFWTERFFASDYLHHDIPYPGAVEFVHFFASNPGNDVVYLTGRDIKKMLIGTERSLQLHGFPTPSSPANPSQNVFLAMKPSHGITDVEFKGQWFDQVEKFNFKNIWFFENEPTNIERIASDHPTVEIIFFDSTHSGQLASPVHFPTIENYL